MIDRIAACSLDVPSLLSRLRCRLCTSPYLGAPSGMLYCSPTAIIRYELAAQSDGLHALSLWRTNTTSTTESSLRTRAIMRIALKRPEANLLPASGANQDSSSSPSELTFQSRSWRAEINWRLLRAAHFFCTCHMCAT